MIFDLLASHTRMVRWHADAIHRHQLDLAHIQVRGHARSRGPLHLLCGGASIAAQPLQSIGCYARVRFPSLRSFFVSVLSQVLLSKEHCTDSVAQQLQHPADLNSVPQPAVRQLQGARSG